MNIYVYSKHTLTEIISDSLLQSMMVIRRVLLNGPEEVSEGTTVTRSYVFACMCIVHCTRMHVKMVEVNICMKFLQSRVTMLAFSMDRC